MKIRLWFVTGVFLLGSAALYAMEQSASPMECSSSDASDGEEQRQDADHSSWSGEVEGSTIAFRGNSSPTQYEMQPSATFFARWAKWKEEERWLSIQSSFTEMKKQRLIRTRQSSRIEMKKQRFGTSLEEEGLIPDDLSDLVNEKTRLSIRLAVCLKIVDACRTFVLPEHEQQKLHMQAYLYEQLAHYPDYVGEGEPPYASLANHLKQHRLYDEDSAARAPHELCAKKLIEFFSSKLLHDEGAKIMRQRVQDYAKKLGLEGEL